MPCLDTNGSVKSSSCTMLSEKPLDHYQRGNIKATFSEDENIFGGSS